MKKTFEKRSLILRFRKPEVPSSTFPTFLKTVHVQRLLKLYGNPNILKDFDYFINYPNTLIVGPSLSGF